MVQFYFKVDVADPAAAADKIKAGFASKNIPVDESGRFDAAGYAGSYRIDDIAVHVTITKNPPGIFNWMIIRKVRGFLDD